MKVKVIAVDVRRAEQLAQSIRAGSPELTVQAAAAGRGSLPEAVNGSRPGLIVVDGIDLHGLEEIGRLGQTHPEMDAIVISPEQSPAFLMKAMQAGVREVLPTVHSAQQLQAAVQRMARKRQPVAAPGRNGEVLAFMACKGGSGATFLAANLAHVLSVRGEHSVGLLDLDLQFGDALLMLSDQEPTTDVADVAEDIARLDADLMRSAMLSLGPQLSVLPAPRDLSRALEVKPAHIEAIVKLARTMFDYVVLDIGGSLDAVSLQALDMADKIFPVLQLSVPQARDARRLRALFRSLEYRADRLNWIVNRHQKGGDITLDSIRQTLGDKNLRTVPNQFSAVSASVNQGVPICTMDRGNPVARALHELAQTIAPIETTRKDGWLSSMFTSKF